MFFFLSLFIYVNAFFTFNSKGKKCYSLQNPSYFNIITNVNNASNEKLNVIVTFQNPCSYSRRYKLTNEFLERMKQNRDIIIYIIELSYANQQPIFADENNPRHLHITTETDFLWHKENLINIAVNKLLPKSWKTFAWIDSDIKFDNPSWARDALMLLNSSKDVVQLFSKALSYEKNGSYISHPSFAFQNIITKKISKKQKLSRTGLAWAISRKAYFTVGKLLDFFIIGGGDKMFANSLLNSSKVSVFLPPGYSNEIVNLILLYQKRACKLNIGYVPGIVRHFYHGNKKNRHYYERQKILIKHKFNPKIHLISLDNGLLVPSKLCPRQLLHEIQNYFKQRNEDD